MTEQTEPMWRQALPWATAGVVPAIVQVGVYAITGIRPRELIVDASSLTDDLSFYSGSISLFGIVAWFCAAAVLLLAWSMIRRDAPLRRAMFHLAMLSLLLGVDDGLLLHETIEAPGPDALLVLPQALYALWIVREFRQVLRPAWGLLALAALGFGFSLGVDLVLEGLFEVYVTGVLFMEENAKFFGIACWLGASVLLARTAVRDTQEPAA